MKTPHACLLAVLLVAAAHAPAQTTTPPPYDPLQTFAPLTLPNPVNAYRSSNGAPGPQYWQNRADYDLHATIDTASRTLTASELINYTNNSPDTLDTLWLNLEQNTYRKDARSRAFYPDAYAKYFGSGASDGYILDSVEISRVGNTSFARAVTIVTDTRLQIQLPASLTLLHGDALAIRIHYHYAIPGEWGGRTSVATARQGDIYDIAQWYPRMCVYDDLRGWDTQPYLANEFYLEYGSFHYDVTVPSNFIVAGSGELLNPQDVLTKPELARLEQARHSDATVMIRTADEAAAAATAHPATTKTWRFAMSPTRDVSFSASPAFLWDAARMNIAHEGVQHPAPPIQLAQSVYPIESAGPGAWGRSTEYLKDAVEHFSARWYPYPWPNAVNVAGFSSGMEYPGILFDGIEDKGKELFWITAHEIGHSWFPMIVGSNERRDAWIDEGFNTFIDTFESDEFSNGVYGPKRDGEYAPLGPLSGDRADTAAPDFAAEIAANQTPADQIGKVIAADAAAHGPTILTRADAIDEPYRHPITYFKSAFGLTLLRNTILGPARFDPAFRKFIAAWAYKHPTPSDFFRFMQSDGGEDLDYFWRGWYFNNWQLDLAITAAEPLKEPSPASAASGPAGMAPAASMTMVTKSSGATPLPFGVTVTVANLGQLVLPATLRATLTDGSHVDIAIPAETWLLNTTHTFTIPTSSPVSMITIDPNHDIPDANRANNVRTLP